jgi:hypothetical protein
LRGIQGWEIKREGKVGAVVEKGKGRALTQLTSFILQVCCCSFSNLPHKFINIEITGVSYSMIE